MISKLIRSALNNSSPYEAAAALKRAASLMHSQGVNPASLLQIKGDESAYQSGVSDEQIINLVRESREARETITKLRGELREAKQLAIKWSKAHDDLKEINEALEVSFHEAVDACKEEIDQFNQLVNRYNNLNDKYNNLVMRFNTLQIDNDDLLTRFNNNVDEFNDLAERYDELKESL